MTRLHTARHSGLAWLLGVSALLGTRTAAKAQEQETVAPAVPSGYQQPHAFHPGGFFHPRPDPVPRTYSYLYDTWFNQPRHFRVVGPDGKVRWRKTVRGLPMGTPWTPR